MSDWVFFLVRNLDPQLLKRLRQDARRESLSLQNLMRRILCEHYELDCPPLGKTTRIEHGSRTQRLRLHPEVWEALKADSEESGESMQNLVHAALAGRYVTEEAA